MIKMIAGVFGMDVNGIKKAMDKNSGPFKAGADQEAELVRMGLAVYVDEAPMEPPTDPELPELPDLPEGVTAIPEYNVDMKAAQLREIGKLCGLTFPVGMSKAEMVAALDAHIEENTVEGDDLEGEPAFDFDPAEAVQ